MAIKKWFFLSLLSGIATLALAYPDADKQGTVYKGLQNIHDIAAMQGINPEDTTIRWEIGENNLMEWLLAPWDKNKVNEALSAYRQEYGSIAGTAAKVVNGAICNNFDASGHLITIDEHRQLLQRVEQTDYLQNFHPQARAITVADADAQFFPGDVFVTNNLARASNVAASQKSSSTLIPRNTPVFVLGQLMTVESAGLDPADDGWVALWRPEFGLKFTRAKHIALVDDALVTDYRTIRYESGFDNQLNLTGTSRVTGRTGGRRLPLGAPVLSRVGQYLLAERYPLSPETLPLSSSSVTLRLYSAQLSLANLSVDPAGTVESQVRQVPLSLNYRNYLNQLSNTLLKYPADYVAPEHNENRYFAFGEGTIGPDGERGMDASTFALKLIQPFGKWLPRYSVHQVEEGVKTRLINTTMDATLEENYQAMLEHCRIGNFVSTGRGNNMACLGSISLAQLGQLSETAYAEAVTTGGMTEQDPIPLLALSTVGLTHTEDVVTDKPAGTIDIPSGESLHVSIATRASKTVWYITGKAGVYPVFKSGYLGSYIRDGRSLTFFSYFKPASLAEQR